MLAQIRLLGVALATVLADVRLQMLRLFVLGYVLKQAGLVGEALVAGVAFVRFVGLVTPRVRLEIGQLREGFLAAGVTTLVRFVAGVGANVLLQVRQLGEFALADFATVRLDAQMDPRVLREVARVGERLRALTALVRLRFSQMHLRVQLQIGLRTKHLKSN